MQNLLEQLIVCINYSGLLDSDIEDIVKTTRDFFRREGFSIGEGMHKNVNVQLNDPFALEDEINSSIESMRRFSFELNNVHIGITRESIEMTIAAGIEYQGFEAYNRYISCMISVIYEKYGQIITITRMGIRKINSLFIKNLNSIGNYFDEHIFNCNAVKGIIAEADETTLLSNMHFTMYNSSRKVNFATEIQIGEGQELSDDGIRPIEVYRTILDIDVYWDLELAEYDSVYDKLVDMNGTATRIYENCLNPEFKERLRTDLADQDSNIFGGIKNGKDF